jgi:hypothetical protein
MPGPFTPALGRDLFAGFRNGHRSYLVASRARPIVGIAFVQRRVRHGVVPLPAPVEPSAWSLAMACPSPGFAAAASERREGHRDAIHAVPQPGRRWSVVEYVAEVASASAAEDFGACHAQAGIWAFEHRVV